MHGCPPCYVSVDNFGAMTRLPLRDYPPYQYAAVRDSTCHDIEVNPGPEYWASDPERYGVQANLGLELHRFDVRSVLLCSGVPLANVDTLFQELTTADACARYYKSTVKNWYHLPLIPPGSSSVAVARAFRAVYMELRVQYVQYIVYKYTPASHRVEYLGKFPMHFVITGRTSKAGASDSFNTDSLAGALVQSDASDTEFEPSVPLHHTTPLVREYCEVCECYVNPEGHDLRCRPVGVGLGPAVDRTLRLSSWIGDALQTLDVRTALIDAKLPVNIIAKLMDNFKSAGAQRGYLQMVGMEPAVYKASKDHAVSTIFESMYCGDFRRNYMKWLVTKVPQLIEKHGTDKSDTLGYVSRFGLKDGLDFSFLSDAYN